LAFPYCIIEAAILFEAHFNTHVDKVIVVSAPKYERVERVLRRDQISYEQVVARMKNQWEEPQLLAQADFVVKNPNHEMMLPQIIKIHHALQA
jgi:dephospho-CoA kinase